MCCCMSMKILTLIIIFGVMSYSNVKEIVFDEPALFNRVAATLPIRRRDSEREWEEAR